jgi:Ca2+-binding EF-hand superfamily protein
VAQAFHKWDKTGTGKFDFFLFSSLVRHELLVMPAHLPDDKLKMVFGVIDLDNSGTIELDEFLEFVSGKVGTVLEYSSAVPVGG